MQHCWEHAFRSLSSVGNDEQGDTAIQTMQRVGVDVTHLQRDQSAKTGTVGVSIDSVGKPTFVIHPHAAWDRTQWRSELEPLIANADAVYFGTLGQREMTSRATIEKALAIATERNVRRVLDVNLRAPYFDDELIQHSISLASVVKLSDDEFPRVMTACGIDATLSPHDRIANDAGAVSVGGCRVNPRGRGSIGGDLGPNRRSGRNCRSSLRYRWSWRCLHGGTALGNLLGYRAWFDNGTRLPCRSGGLYVCRRPSTLAHPISFPFFKQSFPVIATTMNRLTFQNKIAFSLTCSYRQLGLLASHPPTMT